MDEIVTQPMASERDDQSDHILVQVEDVVFLMSSIFPNWNSRTDVHAGTVARHRFLQSDGHGLHGL